MSNKLYRFSKKGMTCRYCHKKHTKRAEKGVVLKKSCIKKVVWWNTSYELLITSWKPKSTNWNSKMQFQIHDLKFTSYKFNFKSYEFKTTSDEFKSTSCEFKSRSSRIISSRKTQVNSLKISLFCKILRLKSFSNSWGNSYIRFVHGFIILNTLFNIM